MTPTYRDDPEIVPYKYEPLEMKTIYTESDCKDGVDRSALRCAIEAGKPVSIGEVVAIPPNWIPASKRQTR